MMPSRRENLMQAIVVTFDQLAMRLVGCYGNEWVETPSLDRLSSTGIVFDNCFTDSLGPGAGQSWLTGRHSLRPGLQTAQLGHLLQKSGVTTHLIRDSTSHWNPGPAAGFQRIDLVHGRNGLEVDPAEVPIARLIQRGRGVLQESSGSGNQLLWLHAPSPGLPPEGFATLYHEDFEERGFPQADIPREAWGQQISVAAGSISLVDHWIGELMASVATAKQPTLLVMTAARGQSWLDDFTLAAGIQTDSPAQRLRDQEVKVPLLLWVAGDDRFKDLAGSRCDHFSQCPDLLATLMDWFNVEAPSTDTDSQSVLRAALSSHAGRDSVYFSDEDLRFGVRTKAWSCLMRLPQQAPLEPRRVQVGDAGWPSQVQLFSKPEDIWDITDLSTQWPQVCEAMLHQLNLYRAGEDPPASAV